MLRDQVRELTMRPPSQHVAKVMLLIVAMPKSPLSAAIATPFGDIYRQYRRFQCRRWRLMSTRCRREGARRWRYRIFHGELIAQEATAWRSYRWRIAQMHLSIMAIGMRK